MGLVRRIKSAVFEFVVRMAPARPVRPGEGARADFSTHPGGKGMRFTKRLRDRFRNKWLRIR